MAATGLLGPDLVQSSLTEFQLAFSDCHMVKRAAQAARRWVPHRARVMEERYSKLVVALLPRRLAPARRAPTLLTKRVLS